MGIERCMYMRVGTCIGIGMNIMSMRLSGFVAQKMHVIRHVRGM